MKGFPALHRGIFRELCNSNIAQGCTGVTLRPVNPDALLVVATCVKSGSVFDAGYRRLPAFAQRKDCSELKSEIDAKITANGVAVFTTTIVDNDADVDGKVVGTCDGGAKNCLQARFLSRRLGASTDRF